MIHYVIRYISYDSRIKLEEKKNQMDQMMMLLLNMLNRNVM